LARSSLPARLWAQWLHYQRAARAARLALTEYRTGANMSNRSSSSRRNTFVSFSGIDGAGKSTQIENLHNYLHQAGLRVRIMQFWDEVAVLKRMREFSSHTLFDSEQGIGTPEKPVNRRDKNVRSWYMTPVRFFLCLLDAMHLRRIVRRVLKSADFDVLICDRYLYDQLATLWLHGRLSQIYIRLLLTIVPHPDVAYVLDANPAEARERKPEYPLEFLNRYRAAYLGLSKLAHMTVIAPGPAPDVAQDVILELLRKLPLSTTQASLQIPSWDEKTGMNVSSSLP
jgi:thymidylate kinase